LLADTGMADPDLARVLARVGEEAARAKRFDLATISFEMAISQWSVLGAAEEVRNTVQKMGALVTKPDLAVAGTSSHPESGQKEA